MAQTHENTEHPFRNEWFKSFEKKAAHLQATGEASITGGKPGEKVLSSWQSYDVDVRQLPADEHGVIRISIGGGNTPIPLNYLRFRGPHGACVDLLRKALKALESGPDERN